MESFTPIASTIGGILIGLSAAILLLFNGRIAGISGIFGGAIWPKADNFSWQLAFVAGLVAGGGVMFLINPQWFVVEVDRSLLALAVAGLLVGFGTRLGSGCTSGHGVCGLSRFSARSLVATLSFMGAGTLTVLVINQVFGGAL